MDYTGTITIKIKPKLLNHTPLGDGFFSITSRVSFSEGGSDSAFTFTESSDGSLGEAQFSMFTMFPHSITSWPGYSGASVDDQVQAALNDPTYDFEIPARTEVQIYEDNTLIFGGIVTEVSRVREGGSITTKIKCADYTALLDEVVIDRYKAPYETYDYQLIRGGYLTDKEKNGVKVTKIVNGSSGGGSPKRLITVTLDDSHDVIVGQKVEIDRTTNYNGTYTVASILSLVSYTALSTSSYTVLADETSGRSTPYTISFFEDINKTDPYTGSSISNAIDYDNPLTTATNYVVTGGSDWRFSPITYVPDASYPEKLGAKILLPLSEGKSDDGRSAVDPKALDSDERLRLYRIENAITERYIVSQIGAYNAASNYIDITTISDHNFQTGQYLNLGNVDTNRPGDYTAGFRGDRQSSKVLRITTDIDPGFSLQSATITGATCDGIYTTYTANNAFKVGSPVGIIGITHSGAGTEGSYNVDFSIIEEATATTFKIRNVTTRTYASGGTAYSSFVLLNELQTISAAEKRLKIIAAQRIADITTVWYDSATKYFNVGDVITINGDATFDGRFTVTESGAAEGNSGLPLRASYVGRTNNVAQIIISKNASGYPEFNAHPFNKGDVVDVTLPTGYTSANATAVTILGEGSPTGSGTSAVLYYPSTGSNIKFTKKFTNAQIATTSVTFSTKTLSYIKFSDERADTVKAARAVKAGAYISLPYYAWDAVASGSRSAATPSASFVTMPNDSIVYLGGRQSVDFESSEYMGLSTRKSAEIAFVERASDIVTIYTKAPHSFAEGESVTIAADSPYTGLNGTYGIDNVTKGTFKFSLAGSTIAKNAAAGSCSSDGLGFYAAGGMMSSICVIRPESLPSSGQYQTIWHHGSTGTGQRRELQINDSGALCFMTINNSGSTERFVSTLTVAADETAIVYVSYNPTGLHMYPAESGDETYGTSGKLTIQKNDETPQTNTPSTRAVTNRGNFTVGYGYTNSGTATSFFDGLIGNIYVFDRVLRNTEQEQIVSWMAHYFTLSDLLSETNDYRYLADHPGKDEANRAKEPFNGMTLRQAMDYISKKTGSQYWVDANKKLHYQRRNVKNLVQNPTFEDKFGGSSAKDWTLGSFTISSRSSGPYGYGFSATATGSSELIARSAFFPVAANQVYFASAMIKTSDAAKSLIKIRFYDASGTQVGAEKPIGSGVSANNSWEKMWGMVKVPTTAGITQAALIFHHTSHTNSYDDYYADPKVVKITSAFGFADYGIAPGSSTEMLFDTDLNEILPFRTFESPENISQQGTQANRLYLYGKATTVDSSNNIITPYVVTGQVIRYTFDHVQGVWNTHGKIIEASKTDSNPETIEDAALAASSFWAENGQSIESYDFAHPNNGSSGRLTVGSIIPYFWSEVGIIEPLVVKSQTTTVLGGEMYYNVTLAGEPAFQKNAIILVQKQLLTENLGSGSVKYMTPSKVTNFLVQSFDNDGKVTTTGQNVVLTWSIDRTDPRNKKVTHFEIAQKKQKLKQGRRSTANMTDALVSSTNFAVKRSAASAGGIAVVTLKYTASTGLKVGSYITVAGGQIGKKATNNPPISGEYEVTSVSSDGRTITYNQFAPATSGIIAISAKRRRDLPSIVVTWYEEVGSDTASRWDRLAISTSTSYTDDGDTDASKVAGKGVDIKYRYQYRVRAVAKDIATGVELFGPWSYVPAGYLNTSSDTGWIYISDNLFLAGVPDLQEPNT
jgi:hypothetical protein